jgi:hypothetical protein
MATTKSWGYTNTTVSDVEVNPTKVDLFSSYAKVDDAADKVVYDNSTAPFDQGEKVSMFYRNLPKVDTDNPVSHPAPVKDGFQFIVKLDAIHRGVLDNETIIDSPQVMMLTVRGGKDGMCDSAAIEEQFKRLIGTVYDFTNSRWRFDELMRSALEVRNN